MRIALLSDIHANLHALKLVLNDADLHQVDGYWMLGDVVGRGFQPVPVAVELMRLYRRQDVLHQACWLTGNHDWLLLGHMPTGFTQGGQSISTHQQAVSQMIERHRQTLRSRQKVLDWLDSLPTRAHPRQGLYLAHAAYSYDEDGNVNEVDTYMRYLETGANIRGMLSQMVQYAPDIPRLVLGGHTHRAGIWQLLADNRLVVHPKTTDEPLDLTTGPVYINPGSVGFPKGDERCPTYMLLDLSDDLTTARVETRTLPYGNITFRYPDTYYYPTIFREELDRCD